jgi:glycosyltransferase involved in cell wall biosynthesis
MAASPHMVLVAHPEIQHSHHLAAALHAYDMLGLYLHGAALPDSVAAEIPRDRRRRVHWFQPLRRSLPYVLSRNRTWQVLMAMLRYYDWTLARRLPIADCRAVVAYEGSALRTFQRAKRLGMACILDAANVHHRLQNSRLAMTNDPAIATLKDREVELADLVITCSSLACDSYIAARVPLEKIRSVPLGVDTVLFASRNRLQGEKAREPVRFCSAGLLDQRKGIDLLTEASQRLRGAGHDFTLTFAGGKVGADPALAQKLENLTRITGRVSHSKLPEFYSKADVLVLPSRFDSFGMVVAEALACGLPAIVTDNVGAKDMIQNGVNGWIIPAGNLDALTELMAWCATHPEAVRAMSAAARQSAEARDWSAYRREAGETIRTFLENCLPQNG